MTTVTCPDCTWTSKPSTPAKAAYSLRQHSCAKHRAKLASAERGRARAAAIDRTPKPCLHKQADHSHGTYAAYVLDTCRCLPCARANADYEHHRVRAKAYGRWTHWADAQPVREHLEKLRAAGIGYKQAAQLAGVNYSATWKLIYGKTRPDGTRTPSTRVKASTARALLAVQPGPASLAGGALIDATGTRRRLQALAAIGWSAARLATESGLERQAFDAVITAARTRVTASTARAVADVYDRLWDTPPTATDRHVQAGITRTVNRARRSGWSPPLAWDEATIDDPAESPYFEDPDQPDSVIGTTVEDAEWLMGQDTYTWQTLADRLGTTTVRLRYALTKADRTDLADELWRNTDAAAPDTRYEGRVA